MQGVLDAFDSIGFAAILADAHGAIHQRNGRAEELFPNLFSQEDALEADHRRAVGELVACALDLELQEKSCVPVAFQLNGGRQLILHAAMAGSRYSGDETERCAVLMLIHPSEPRELSGPLLRGAFGLTKSEILLARYLCLGKSLKEIARIRETSVATLRVQLRGLFAKTRTKRQAELVALLARLPPAPTERRRTLRRAEGGV